MDYKTSGVDIEAASSALDRVGALIRRTHGAHVVRLESGFAGAFRLGDTDRILLASIDGVGTKLMIAVRLGRYRSVGGDLVRHCVNDVLVHGGRPLVFLDYVGTARLRAEWLAEVVGGMADACGEVGCALIGGETAEMPGIYHGDDFDLVGAIVGEVDAGSLLDGGRVRPGDMLLGLASDGLHTNGFSLAREVVRERAGDDLARPLPGSETSWGDALLAPHRSYYRALAPEIGGERVHALAHVTGGGIGGNLTRVLPEGLVAEVDRASWPVPEVFGAIASLGEVSEPEMFRAFNMGIGYVVVTPSEAAPALEADLRERGERVFRIGRVRAGDAPGGHRVDLGWG